MVVAQLAEQSHLRPEIRGSISNIGKFIPTNCKNWKDENKEKEAGNGPSLNKSVLNINKLIFTLTKGKARFDEK